MALQEQFCHNAACWAHGRRGEGPIVIQSQREGRYRCKRCDKTFNATKRRRAHSASRFHEHIVQAGRVELGQLQADELRVQISGGVLWMATALAVASRLGCPLAGRGGAVSAHRDRRLIHALLERVRTCGPTQDVLLCVDGLCSDVSRARRLFGEAVRTGQPGRPPVRQAAGRAGGGGGRAGAAGRHPRRGHRGHQHGLP